MQPGRDSLDSTYAAPMEPMDDASSGDIGPIDQDRNLSLPSDNNNEDLLDEDPENSTISLPGGID